MSLMIIHFAMTKLRSNLLLIMKTSSGLSQTLIRNQALHASSRSKPGNHRTPALPCDATLEKVQYHTTMSALPYPRNLILYAM